MVIIRLLMLPKNGLTEERLLPQKVEPKILRLWLNYSTLIVFEFNLLYVPALDIHETAFLTYAT